MALGMETIWIPLSRVIKGGVDNLTGHTDREQQEQIENNEQVNAQQGNQIDRNTKQTRKNFNLLELLFGWTAKQEFDIQENKAGVENNADEITEIKKLAKEIGIDVNKWDQVKNYQEVRNELTSINSRLAEIPVEGSKLDDATVGTLTPEQHTKIKEATAKLREAARSVIISDDPRQNLQDPNAKIIMDSLGALDGLLEKLRNGELKGSDHVQALIDEIEANAKNLPLGVAMDMNKTLVTA